MSDAREENQEFEWIVGQSLTPKNYSHLGKIWEVGKIWMSTKNLEHRDESIIAEAGAEAIVVPEKTHKVGGKRRPGLAKEEDLLKEDRHISARLFGPAIPKKK